MLLGQPTPHPIFNTACSVFKMRFERCFHPKNRIGGRLPFKPATTGKHKTRKQMPHMKQRLRALEKQNEALRKKKQQLQNMRNHAVIAHAIKIKKLEKKIEKLDGGISSKREIIKNQRREIQRIKDNAASKIGINYKMGIYPSFWN